MRSKENKSEMSWSEGCVIPKTQSQWKIIKYWGIDIFCVQLIVKKDLIWNKLITKSKKRESHTLCVTDNHGSPFLNMICFQDWKNMIYILVIDKWGEEMHSKQGDLHIQIKITLQNCTVHITASHPLI